MKRRRLLLLISTVLLFSLAAVAAIQNAVIYGTVYDATGAPMSGITVLLENPALGLTRVAITGEDGSYTIAEIPPAEGYRVTATRAGQKLDVRVGITVNVGDERVIVPALREQVAQTAAEPVEKKVEQAVAVEAISPSIGGVITAEQLRSLPLYNRNFLALGLLTPNVREVEQGSALEGATFSVAGSRPSSNLFLLDGSDNVASSSNQAVPFQVNDSIQEFRVTSSLAGAEFGRNSGGVVNVVTRRGTNSFHGSAFGYFGHDKFNADSPLSVYNGSGFDRAAAYAGSTTSPFLTWGPVTYNDYVATSAFLGNFFFGAPFCTDSISATAFPGSTPCAFGGFGLNTPFDPAALLSTEDSKEVPFQSKQFGINAGGALMPDKWFLFGSYEGTLIDNPNPVFERVPSTFDRTYNAQLAAGLPFAAPYFFPETDPNFVLAQNVLSLFPAANVVGVPGVLEFFRGEADNYTHVHNYSVRTDIVQTDKTSWTLRYSLQDLNQLHSATLPTTAAYAGNGSQRDALNHNLTLTNTHSFGARLVNEARFGFNRFRVGETPQDNGTTIPGVPGAQLMSFYLAGLDPQYSGQSNAVPGSMMSWTDSLWFGQPWAMFPTTDGQFPFARIGAPGTSPSTRRDMTWFAGDNMSWTLGKHALKFGGEYRRLSNRFYNGAFARGAVFSGNIGEFTSDSNTAWTSFETFRAPSFDFAMRQSEPYDISLGSYAWSGYIQDTWRAHPRLTISAGLRYEFFSVPSEENDQLWNFDPAANGLVQAGGTAVIDQFGQSCAALREDFTVYQDVRTQLPWNCAASGDGRVGTSDRNNFAPRVGFAFDVFGDGKTVLRGGVGWYFDHLPVSYAAQLMFNRPQLHSVDNPQLIYGMNFLSTPCFNCGLGNSMLDPAVLVGSGLQPLVSATSAFGISARDLAHDNTPYNTQINASIQHQFSPKVLLELGYMGSMGRNLPVVYNSGFENEWFCTVTPGCDFLGPVFTMTNQAESNFHSMLVRLKAADWKGLRVNAAYNWSRGSDNSSNGIFPVLPFTVQNYLFGPALWGQGNPAIICLYDPAFCAFPGRADVIGGGGSVGGPSGTSDTLTAGLTTTGAGGGIVSRYLIPQDPINFLRDDYGLSDFHSKHRMVVDFTWQVPSLQNAWGAPKWLDYWEFSGIFTGRSGQPFTIFAGPVFGEVTQRANVVGPVEMTGDPNAYIDTTNLRFNFCEVIGVDFDLVNPGPCLGDSGRNAFTGPSLMTVDLALQKSFPWGDGKSISFRTEAYNLFNRANFYNPVSSISLDGATFNPDFGKIKSAQPSRRIQFALRFNW